MPRSPALLQLLKAVGDDPRREELQAMIASVDADGNGVIDFEVRAAMRVCVCMCVRVYVWD